MTIEQHDGIDPAFTLEAGVDGEDAAVQAAPVPIMRPADVPEKFWDSTTGEIRVETLLKSYRELERRLAQADFPDPNSPEGRHRLHRLLGCPNCADDYVIDVAHGYFTSDPEMNARLHELGFTQDQVQAVYDLAVDHLVPIVLNLAAQADAEREVDRLVTAFGGAEKWADVSRQLLAFGQKNLSPSILQSLASSFDGVQTLYRMMLAGTPSHHLGQGEGSALVDPTDRLHDLIRDPRYWRDRDPDFMAKVSDAFEQVYG